VPLVTSVPPHNFTQRRRYLLVEFVWHTWVCCFFGGVYTRWVGTINIFV
jgi:hypothetical protein